MAYLKRYGFVGIGIVTDKAVNVDDFRYKGRSIRSVNLIQPSIFQNSDNDKAEYLIKVSWKKAVDREQAKWKRKAGLFSSQLIKASLQGQPRTIEYLEKEFEIRFLDLLVR